MSALRLGRPGQPVQLVVIDDGAVGRISFTRYGIRQSGEFVVGESERTRKVRLHREAKAKLAAGGDAA